MSWTTAGPSGGSWKWGVQARSTAWGESEHTNLRWWTPSVGCSMNSCPIRPTGPTGSSRNSSPTGRDTMRATPSTRASCARSWGGSPKSASRADCAGRWSGIWSIGLGASASWTAAIGASVSGLSDEQKRHRSRGWLRQPALSLDPHHQQTTAASLRQAHGLLSPFRAHAGGDPGDSDHYHPPRHAVFPGSVRGRQPLGNTPGLCGTAGAWWTGAGLYHRQGIYRLASELPDLGRQHLLRPGPDQAAADRVWA